MLIDGLEIEIIENLPVKEFLKVFSELDLLPKDALIAATCKNCGIKKIATFDGDFRGIDFPEVLDLCYQH